MSDSELAAYYADLPFEQFETSFLMRTDRAVVGALSELPPNAAILDYGCGVGRILSAAERLSNSFGIEINSRSADIARSKGIQILKESELAGPMRGSLDAIILSDVYEHLVHPMQTLHLLAGCLKSQGRLIIATGNAEAFPMVPRFGEYWYFQLPGHLQVLCPPHVNWIADQLGLQVSAIERMSHYDVSITSRFAQNLRRWSYEQFRSPGHPYFKAILRTVPYVKRAATWRTAPGVTYQPDHVVIVLRKP